MDKIPPQNLGTGGGITKFCITTWGDPAKWYYAEYLLENGESIKGFSTLELLAKSISCNKIYIVVLDTLASICNANSYRDVVDSTREYVERFLCLDGGPPKIKIIVIPGRMTKEEGGKRSLFQGDARDAKLVLLLKLYLDIVEELRAGGRRDSDDTIVLDLTHGINYLPVITREVVEELAAILSTLRKSVELIIYNADPYPNGARIRRAKSDVCRPEATANTNIPKLSYNSISRTLVHPWHLTRFLSYDDRIERTLSDVRGCSPILENRSLIGVAQRIVASFRVGALIEMVDYIRGVESLDQAIESMLRETLNCWQDKASVKRLDDVCSTEMRRLFSAVRLLIHAHAISTAVKGVIGGGSMDCRAIRLGWIEKLYQVLLKGSEVTESLIKMEISKMKNSVSVGRWTVYREVIRQRNDVDICKEDRVEEDDKRNFIAHTGFHTDVIEVQKSQNDILIKIREDCSKTVDEILSRIAKDLVKQPSTSR